MTFEHISFSMLCIRVLKFMFVSYCIILYFGIWPQCMKIFTQWLLLKLSPFGVRHDHRPTFLMPLCQTQLAHFELSPWHGPDAVSHWSYRINLLISYIHERKRDFSSCSFWWVNLKIHIVFYSAQFFNSDPKI